MFRKVLLGLTVIAAFLGTMSLAQDRPISGSLPWNNEAAEPVLEQRLADMFPDGTPVAKLDTALDAERFSMVSDDRGLSSATSEGRRFASRGVARFVFGCTTRVSLRWQQVDGQVFEMEGYMHQGCL
ncbi:hypothetical protein L0666_01910 [Octadecabacter sp. CECT 8868]|uniref:hypothetical protein n=1 Tax=Octadecabacter algicola TaxID=2909342 RepID=UPI001F25F36B|nr:hypothetical protein [Octadecabacter algicola]MCF2903728.1 hypothetical protein [Octadecabacter algicola]